MSSRDGVNPPATPNNRELDNEKVLNIGAQSLLKGADAGFNIYRYPSELATDNHPHYVMFFIVERSSQVSGAEVATLRDGDGRTVKYDYSKNNTGVAKTNASATQLRGFAGAAGTMEAKSKVIDIATDTGVIAGGLAGAAARTGITVAGVTAGAAIGAGSVPGFLLPDVAQVMLKDAIALYMTGSPSVQYKAEWSSQDLGLFGGATSQNQALFSNGVTGFFKGLSEGLTEGPASYILKQADKDFGGFGNVGAAASAASGTAVNPFTAQVFKNMGFRSFSFDYVFLPKNREEYQQIQQIIFTFKKYMHPVLGAGKFIMGYPAEFIIAYYHKENLNNELFRISNCALTGMDINYGAGGDFVTFKDIKGAPVEISIKLDFTELEILTRERIEAGF